MILGVFTAAFLVSACGDQRAGAELAIKEEAVPPNPTTPNPTAPNPVVADQTGEQPGDQTADLISLTGTRLTQGNAVECPTLRDAAGVVHSLSYLSPAVALGGRVTVRGVYGITTTCLGTVLVVQQETILPE